uniref:sterile alpha motif domain-containing protein 15 n=1 Tax=Jaculus jaculus TaxID=51337 RepID=UPI001E1B4235|nr:sterile alpha motif domain-containing protein 15 [Jaculus jaculus]
MAEVPEDYDSGPDENETLESERPEPPGVHRLPEDVGADAGAEAAPEPAAEADPEPPETEPGSPREDEAGRAEREQPPAAGTWGEEELPRAPEREPSVQTEPEGPRGRESASSAGMGGGLDGDVGVAVAEPPTEARPETEGPPRLGEPYAETGPEQSALDLPGEEPVGSGEETALPPAEMTGSEIAEEEQRTEPSEVTEPEFPDPTPRKSPEEADIPPPEETKPEVPEETGPGPLEQAAPDSSEENTKSTGEKVPEALEQLKPGLPEEEPREPADETSPEPPEMTAEIPEETRSSEGKMPETTEETDVVPPQETRAEVQEETGGGSVEEDRVLEPLEDSELKDLNEEQRKSSETIGPVPPEKSKSEPLESSEEKDPELLEQTESEFPKEEPTKPTEVETDQVPPQTEPTKENLPDEPELREEDTGFSKEDRPESSQYKHSVDESKLVYPEYQTVDLLEKEADDKEESPLGSPRESEEESVTDRDSQELLEVLQPTRVEEESSNIHLLDPSVELRKLFSEKNVVGLAPELEKLEPEAKESKPKKPIDLQFKHLTWSPEEVAEWISQLGFPQYKECFTTNFISGRKLIHVNCSNLPQMGITDFEDMKVISRHTRELLGIEEPLFSRTIRLPYRDNIGLFLERKGHSGIKSDSLTLSEFVKTEGLKDYEPEIIVSEETESLLDTEQ